MNKLEKMLLLTLCLISFSVQAQLSPTGNWAADLETKYQMRANEEYITAGGSALRMHIYSRRDVTTPQPTLIFFHGGFWVAGSKNTQILALIPWIEKGWNVVNVGYRLADTALAPAALVDTFCALRHINANAERFNIDTTRLVTSGQSAGGHLALSLAMMQNAKFDENCPEGDTPEVAAVINWFGVTDVKDVISGVNRSDFAARWFGDMDEVETLILAENVSPLNYVRDDLPPILSIHGDADMVVPYAQAVALQEALDETNVLHRLMTIPGGGHGRFTAGERRRIYQTINAFLKEAGIE